MKHAMKWYINHKLATPQAFHDWCLAKIPVYEWSNKQKTIRSSNRVANQVIKKRLTKRSNLDLYDKFYSFAIILVTEKCIEIQSFDYWHNINNGKETIDIRPGNFERFADDEHIKLCRSYNREDIYEGLARNTVMSGPYTNTFFYDNDWQEKIRTISELKYLEFGPNIWREDLDHLYKYRTEIEFAQKIHADVLAREIIKGVGDMRIISREWLKKNKSFFKNSDLSFGDFEFKKRIRDRNGRVVPGIEKYMNYKDLRMVPKGIGITSFQNWIIKNDISIYYYRDYLALLKAINVDPTGDATLAMPKDIRKAHDEATTLYNQIMEEEMQRREAEKEALEAKRANEELKVREKLETEIGNYDFILPRNIGDIVQEGKQMHNCVGTYVERHKSGKTTIIFIRRKEAPEKSLCTMEYRGGDIVQLRAKYNQEPTKEVVKVANEWLKWVKQKRKAVEEC